MDTRDLILFPLYLALALFLSMRMKKSLAGDDPYLQKTFTRFFWIKILCAIMFALVYQFYYGGGDTFGFFYWGQALVKTFFKDPGTYINFVVFNDYESFFSIKYNTKIHNSFFNGYYYIFKESGSDSFFIKIVSAFSFFGANAFLPTAMLITLFSIFGTWRLFQVFVDYNPNNKNLYSYAILFLPSVCFWGSAILKDTMTFTLLGILTYYIYFGLLKRKYFNTSIIKIFLLIFIISNIKGYIVLSFLPAAVYWVFSSYKEKIKNTAIRNLSAPIFLGMSIVFIVLITTVIGDELGRFSTTSIERTAKDYQMWHTIASEGGSAYSIGDVGDYSLGAIIKYFPLAVNVTFFRPYLWEVKNVVMLFAAIESVIIFYFFLVIFFKAGMFNPLKFFTLDSTTTFCLFFAIIFGFAVGFTSYNFGALVRYKIPCIPFLLVALSNIYYTASKRKQQNL